MPSKKRAKPALFGGNGQGAVPNGKSVKHLTAKASEI